MCAGGFEKRGPVWSFVDPLTNHQKPTVKPNQKHPLGDVIRTQKHQFCLFLFVFELDFNYFENTITEKNTNVFRGVAVLGMRLSEAVWTQISFILPLDFPCCYAMRIALLSGYVSVVNITHGASV